MFLIPPFTQSDVIEPESNQLIKASHDEPNIRLLPPSNNESLLMYAPQRQFSNNHNLEENNQLIAIPNSQLTVNNFIPNIEFNSSLPINDLIEESIS